MEKPHHNLQEWYTLMFSVGPSPQEKNELQITNDNRPVDKNYQLH
jgi:hypothetical protein